jgi:hypothetical protein
MDRVLYTAEAVVEGGRAGHGRTTDGRLDVQLSVPVELSGDGGSGTNPEQLFAVGYAACFQCALLGWPADATWMPLIRASPRASGSVRPDTVASRWSSRSTSMRHNCQPSKPPTSWPARMSGAPIPTRRAATSMFSSRSTDNRLRWRRT